MFWGRVSSCDGEEMNLGERGSIIKYIAALRPRELPDDEREHKAIPRNDKLCHGSDSSNVTQGKVARANLGCEYDKVNQKPRSGDGGGSNKALSDGKGASRAASGLLAW